MSKYNIKVLNNNKYEVYVNKNFDDFDKLIKFISSSMNIIIVSEKNVYELYGKDINNIIEGYGCSADIFYYNDENDLKTYLTNSNYCNNDLMIALGGKQLLEYCDKIVDEKNIKYIKVPTSLNAAGVTAYCNISECLLGVYINSSCLSTLEEKDYYSGIAYIMKTAITKSINAYMWIINNLYEISDKDPDTLYEMLDKNFKMLKQIMDLDDPKAEMSFANIICENISLADNNRLTSGEYCALAIIISSLISKNKELLSLEEYLEIRDMFVPFNLPITMDSKLSDGTNIDIEKLANNILASVNEIPLLSKIGKITLSDNVTKEEIVSALSDVIFDEEMDAE